MAPAEWWCQCSVISSAVGHHLVLAVYSSVISQGLLKSSCHIWSDIFFHQSYKTKLPKSKTTPARKCTRSSSPPMIRRRVQYYIISIIFLIPPCPFSKLFWLCGYSHSHVNFGLSFPTRKPAGFCSELLSICKSIWEEFTCCCRVSPWALFNPPFIYIFFNFSQQDLIIARDSVCVTVHIVCVLTIANQLAGWEGGYSMGIQILHK